MQAPGIIIKDNRGRLRARLPEADFLISNPTGLQEGKISQFEYEPQDQYAKVIKVSNVAEAMGTK